MLIPFKENDLKGARPMIWQFLVFVNLRDSLFVRSVFFDPSLAEYIIY